MDEDRQEAGVRTAKCFYCGVKLLRNVVKKEQNKKIYRNYRYPKCGQT